jgi:Septum formation
MPSPTLLPRRGTLLTSFAAVVAALLLLTACSTGSAETTAKSPSGGKDRTTESSKSPTKSTPTHNPAPPPKAGTCRELTFGAIGRYSNQAPTVDCGTSHTALTFAVEQLPEDVAFEGVDIGNDAVQEKASLLCRAEFAKYIGGSAATRALSRLSVTYFVPTQQDFDAGSRWVRCDVIALQSARILAALPETVEGFNDTDGALDDYGVCSRGEPGTTDALLVMCDQDHDYRALTALRLGADDADYPGEKAVGEDGQSRCDDYISDTLGLGGGYTYAWTYPSLDDWDAGQRFGFCWNKTGS